MVPALELGREVRDELAAGRLDLPLPGRGFTQQRWDGLRTWGQRDLAFAKLAEAHVDAVAILAEAGRKPVAGALYAVWASRSRGSGLHAQLASSGNIELKGELRFASGVELVERALVSATYGEQTVLLDLDVRRARPTVHSGTWSAVGMSRVHSPDVTIHRLTVPSDAVIGDPDWYLDRPGFWIGSLGMPAIWLGALESVLETFRTQLTRFTPGPHELAHLGGCLVQTHALRAALAEAAAIVDAEPSGDHHVRALLVRSLADSVVDDVLRRIGRALGPAPLVRDSVHAQRVADLGVWVRQTHAERDLQAIGSHHVGSASPFMPVVPLPTPAQGRSPVAAIVPRSGS